MKTKSFDCVDMKRAAADKIYEQLKNSSPAEQRDFWKSGEEELRSRCKGTFTFVPIAKAVCT